MPMKPRSAAPCTLRLSRNEARIRVSDVFEVKALRPAGERLDGAISYFVNTIPDPLDYITAEKAGSHVAREHRPLSWH